MKQALLIIDAQQALIEGGAGERPAYQKEKLIEQINLVIAKAQTAEAAILFVRDTDVAEGKGEGFQIHTGIQVPEEAPVFNKQATNAFYGTGLLEYVKEKGFGHLVIMGCETQHCIDTAVRTATVQGMDVTLVADGHSTAGSDVLTAEQIIQHHNQILHGHYNVDHFSVVRQAEEDLFVPTHDTYR
ncbi:cysteine hydrolase family protein [Terribacillus saccharophilus]|uniref:cysteine hydrolase family protein n=1 Tax=Terribacillus saccharophilus TaxID=361277 RepID=UPI000BA58FD7|nr:cysteine hydrolase family protein [Terribacillus saccharophilus]PAF16352.1 cysteine hydrolase [Terribacillus saccharophilus]